METQLGLAEGTVVVLTVTIDVRNRGEVNVIVDYTITLTEEDLKCQVLILIHLLKKLKIKLI